jgi:hypothetical protein
MQHRLREKKYKSLADITLGMQAGINKDEKADELVRQFVKDNGYNLDSPYWKQAAITDIGCMVDDNGEPLPADFVAYLSMKILTLDFEKS